jgi:hypothetical protein
MRGNEEFDAGVGEEEGLFTSFGMIWFVLGGRVRKRQAAQKLLRQTIGDALAKRLADMPAYRSSFGRLTGVSLV